MKELILKIAGVNSEAEFYQMYPNQEAFFQAHPEAQEIIAQYKNQSEVEQMANGGMSNKIPVQTESYQGQPEQLVLPDGTIDSVNAKTTHENMGDNTVTDVLPEGTHIQSARNKLTPEQYEQLVSMFTPKVAKERMKQIEQVAKGKNKKISPAEISEYAKKNYQKESTPNSFDTDKLKEGNKKSYIDLSIQMNDLIKAGKELAEGTMPQQMMAWGGVVPKFEGGTDIFGIPGNRNFTSIAPESGYISGEVPASGYLDAQGNFVPLDTYTPWYIPKGVRDYDPNRIVSDKEWDNILFNKNRSANYQNPQWRGNTWDPASPEASEWFDDNLETLKNVLSKEDYENIVNNYSTPENNGFIESNSSKRILKALKDTQKARQIAVDKLNPEFNRNITAKSVAPTWKTIQDLQGNKAFVEKLKKYGINSTNKGTYGQVANLSQEALADIYSTVTDPKELEILNTGNNLDAQWDRRTQRFIPQTFSSNAEKDAWMKSQGMSQAYNWGYDPKNPNNIVVPNVVRTKMTPEQNLTPVQQAENIALGNVNPVNPLPQMQGRNRFNTGLLESQLARGLQGNQGYLNAAMDLNPLYVMETPDTFIRSRQNEIPTGNILYNIERAQRNTANALANQTGDWSTLASNIANAGATAMNQVGDTLTALNEKNVGLYNTTQGLQQDLLSSNVGVRNQNLTNMQNMLNYKRNLLGQKAVKDAELYSKYASSMGENAQKEQNQKLEMLGIMASKPDMFKGQQGQDLMNSIINTYGSYNNPFAGSILDFGLNLFGNRNRG